MGWLLFTLSTAVLTLVVTSDAEAMNRRTVDHGIDSCLADDADGNASASCGGLICSCCYDDGCWICNTTYDDCVWDPKARAQLGTPPLPETLTTSPGKGKGKVPRGKIITPLPEIAPVQ